MSKRACVCTKGCVMPDPASGCGQNSGPEQERFKNTISAGLVIPHRASTFVFLIILSRIKTAKNVIRELVQLLQRFLVIIK